MLKIKTHNGNEYRIEGKELNGEDSKADIILSGKNRYHVIRNGKSYAVTVVKTDITTKTITLRINRKKYSYQVRDKYDEILEKLGISGSAKNIKDLKAPMPGKVLEILVANGETVKKDQAMIVLEAMKMENVIKAPAEVIIKNISIKKGNTVEKNQVLIHFE